MVLYTQKWESWQPTLDATWENKDLSAYVPANAVCEITIVNAAEDTDVLCGVRENGSALNRYVTLHEAEGGGYDAVRMHVTADASSIIEQYGSSTNTTFYLSGYWGGSYTETMNTYTIVADGAWTGMNVPVVPINTVCEIVMRNKEVDAENYAGIRQVGSSNERRFELHETEPNATAGDYLTLFVETDGSQDIEVYTQDASEQEFIAIGYWDNPPGRWTEGRTYTNPPLANWNDYDLTGIAPPLSICEYALVQGHSTIQNIAGIRKKGTSDDRRLTLQEAEDGGSDFFSCHVEVDSENLIEVYGVDFVVINLCLTGYWTESGGAGSGSGLGIGSRFSRTLRSR